MDVVLLLDEHDEVLLATTRSFHSIIVYFFGHNQPGIRVFESPLDSQRGFSPFVGPRESSSVRFQSFVSEFRARDLCHGKQRVSPFYHDSLTTTTDRTTGLLLQSDQLIFGTH